MQLPVYMGPHAVWHMHRDYKSTAARPAATRATAGVAIAPAPGWLVVGNCVLLTTVGVLTTTVVPPVVTVVGARVTEGTTPPRPVVVPVPVGVGPALAGLYREAHVSPCIG